MTVEQAVTPETIVSEPARRANVRVVGPALVGLAMLSAIATFLVLAGLTPIAPTHNVVVTLLLINAVTGLLLLCAIGLRGLADPAGEAGGDGRGAAPHPYRRLVFFHRCSAGDPCCDRRFVTLDRGLDRLFASRTRDAIQNSVIVAEAYLRDHAQNVRSDIMLLSFDVARGKEVFERNPDDLRRFLTFQAQVRGLGAALVFDTNLAIRSRADIATNQVFALPPKDALASVKETEPQIVLLPDTSYVAAVVKLRDYADRYLYVARLLDPRVLAQLRTTEASVSEYAAINERRIGIQVAFALMYTVIALIVLLSAVWIGLDFANRLVAPIRRLIGAATAVSTGNLFVRVPVKQSEGDLANLGETFNRMTQELRTQRDDLVRARDQIDSRRLFTEAVLAGASAGVIGVDGHGRVTILNRSAEKLVDRAEARFARQTRCRSGAGARRVHPPGTGKLAADRARSDQAQSRR